MPPTDDSQFTWLIMTFAQAFKTSVNVTTRTTWVILLHRLVIRLLYSNHLQSPFPLSIQIWESLLYDSLIQVTEALVYLLQSLKEYVLKSKKTKINWK